MKKRLGFPTEYRSFHTALTPTPLTRQPFVIFEEAELEAPNLPYVYEKMLEYGIEGEEKEAVDKALYLFQEGQLSEIDLPSVRDFLMVMYWAKTYADKPSAGYYCDSRVGDALVFGNYRAHADSTLPRTTKDRLTIDLRCFNKVMYPKGMSSGLDFIVDPDERPTRSGASGRRSSSSLPHSATRVSTSSCAWCSAAPVAQRTSIRSA